MCAFKVAQQINLHLSKLINSFNVSGRSSDLLLFLNLGEMSFQEDRNECLFHAF